MNDIKVNIIKDGYPKQVTVSKSDTVKTLMTKAFEVFNITDRYYNKEKYWITLGVGCVNENDNELNKTLQEQNIEEDAVCYLVDVSAVKWGLLKSNIFKYIK